MKKEVNLIIIALLITGINLNTQAAFAGEEIQPIENTNKVEIEKKEAPTPEAQVEKVEVSPIAWNENLKLKDFPLTSSTIYTKQNMTFNEYIVNLEKQYNSGNGNVFSVAIEYGLLLIDTGKLDKAEVVFNKAITDFKGNPTPVIYKAWVNALKGNYKEAKDVWFAHFNEKFSTSQKETLWLPYDVDSLLGLNLIKDYLNDADKKDVISLDKALNRLSTNNKLSAILINEDLKHGYLKNAANKIGVNLAKNPDDPVSITLLGISQILIGQNDEALNLFNKADELYTFSPTNNLMRARALFTLDHKKDSKIAYEKALELDPSIANKKAKTMLKTKSYLSEIKVEPNQEIKKEDIKL